MGFDMIYVAEDPNLQASVAHRFCTRTHTEKSIDCTEECMFCIGNDFSLMHTVSKVCR